MESSEYCPFCIDQDQLEDIAICWNDLAFARYDLYPVTPLHTLIIPFRSIWSFDLATPSETKAVHSLIFQMTDHITNEDPDVCGFNIGWNMGIAAGQTVMHAHMHIIPRRKGDVENPRGGIRNVIPGKGDY